MERATQASRQVEMNERKYPQHSVRDVVNRYDMDMAPLDQEIKD